MYQIPSCQAPEFPEQVVRIPNPLCIDLIDQKNRLLFLQIPLPSSEADMVWQHQRHPHQTGCRKDAVPYRTRKDRLVRGSSI